MKTTMITLAAVLTLFTNVLVAGNDPDHTSLSSTFMLPVHISLLPTIPAVATFDDAPLMIDFSRLAPVIPSEAGFEENVSDTIINIKDFYPELPAEADFE